MENTNKLKKVIIVARHGPRFPIKPLNKLDQNVWKNITNNHNNSDTDDINKLSDEKHMILHSNLTPRGKEFCKSFGRKLKMNYFEKLGC